MESNVGKSPVFNLYPPHMCPQADSYTQPPQPPPTQTQKTRKEEIRKRGKSTKYNAGDGSRYIIIQTIKGDHTAD